MTKILICPWQYGEALEQQELRHGMVLADHASKLQERSERAYEVDMTRMVSIGDIGEESSAQTHALPSYSRRRRNGSKNAGSH